MSGLVLDQTLLELLDRMFVLNVGNPSHNDTLSHPRRPASSVHLLQYSPHMPTVDLNQHCTNMNNKCKKRIQRGLNYKPSGQRNVHHQREAGIGNNAYGMKPMFRPGGRSIVQEWACALLDSECFICFAV
jgi:hypothetical protein